MLLSFFYKFFVVRGTLVVPLLLQEMVQQKMYWSHSFRRVLDVRIPFSLPFKLELAATLVCIGFDSRCANSHWTLPRTFIVGS